MSPHNNTLRLALNKALAAIFTLEDAGCTVSEIRISGGRPFLTVDRRPPSVLNVMANSKSLFAPRTEYIGELMGCRIDWSESHHEPRGRAVRS